MNETLEKIMVFINENTNILIGICLFLIFVLVGYLIDNSIKSRKAKKEFKKLQIKVEPNIENKPKIQKEDNDIKIENSIEPNLFENVISTPKTNINLQNNHFVENNDIPNDEVFENAIVDTNDDTKNVVSDNLKDVVGAIDTINTETQNIDLSDKEPNKKADVLYKNDKKLSEILFSDASREEQSKNIDFNEIPKNNILYENKSVPENMETKKVEIELDESELDNIMKKLKNLSNVDEDDNYTNIF